MYKFLTSETIGATIDASSITGTISLAQLPANLMSGTVSLGQVVGLATAVASLTCASCSGGSRAPNSWGRSRWSTSRRTRQRP